MKNTITEQWGGHLILFPAVRGNESTYIYKRDSKTHAVIFFIDINEDYKKTLDVVITKTEFKDLLTMADLFSTKIIIAAKYNDKQVFANVEEFYSKRLQFLHEQSAFLPKEHFSILKGGK